jgi:hypothetical protein
MDSKPLKTKFFKNFENLKTKLLLKVRNQFHQLLQQVYGSFEFFQMNHQIFQSCESNDFENLYASCFEMIGQKYSTNKNGIKFTNKKCSPTIGK